MDQSDGWQDPASDPFRRAPQTVRVGGASREVGRDRHCQQVVDTEVGRYLMTNDGRVWRERDESWDEVEVFPDGPPVRPPVWELGPDNQTWARMSHSATLDARDGALALEAHGGRLFVLVRGGLLRAWDGEGWTTEVLPDAGVAHDLAQISGRLYALHGHLYCRREDGTWRRVPVAGSVAAVRVFGGRTWVRTRTDRFVWIDGDHVHAEDTGPDRCWQHVVQATRAWQAGDALVVLTQEGLLGRVTERGLRPRVAIDHAEGIDVDPATGRVAWTTGSMVWEHALDDDGPPRGTPVRAARSVLLGDDGVWVSGLLPGLQRVRGGVLETVLPDVQVHDLVAAVGDTVWYQGPRGLYQHAPGGASPPGAHAGYAEVVASRSGIAWIEVRGGSARVVWTPLDAASRHELPAALGVSLLWWDQRLLVGTPEAGGGMVWRDTDGAVVARVRVGAPGSALSPTRTFTGTEVVDLEALPIGGPG